MENKEFNLSEHQRYVNTNSIHMGKNRANKSQDQQKIIRVKDVKEFIKLSESKKFKCNISIGFDDDIQEVILVRDLLKLAGKDLNQNKSVIDKDDDECAYCHHPRILHDKFRCNQYISEALNCKCTKFIPQNKNAPKTMHEEYGEPNDEAGNHQVCEKCGYCKICRDCDKYGCKEESNYEDLIKTGEKLSDKIYNQRNTQPEQDVPKLCHCIFTPSGKKTYECDRCYKLREEQNALCKCGHHKDNHRRTNYTNDDTCKHYSGDSRDCLCKGFISQEKSVTISADNLCECNHKRYRHNKEFGCNLCQCRKFTFQDFCVPKGEKE